MALTTPEGLEEERRLFYVALTRARHTLAIYVPLHYYHRPGARDDAHGYGKQSRFLTEQAEALCERVVSSAATNNSGTRSRLRLGTR
jgi:DNA helicase-2/ATP-dependent DNA helicase PcrA